MVGPHLLDISPVLYNRHHQSSSLIASCWCIPPRIIIPNAIINIKCIAHLIFIKLTWSICIYFSSHFIWSHSYWIIPLSPMIAPIRPSYPISVAHRSSIALRPLVASINNLLLAPLLNWIKQHIRPLAAYVSVAYDRVAEVLLQCCIACFFFYCRATFPKRKPSRTSWILLITIVSRRTSFVRMSSVACS